MTLEQVLGQLTLTPQAPFHLQVGHLGVTVHCPEPLRSTLTAYYAHCLSDEPGGITVHLLPDQTISPEPEWTDWYREPGKAGRKDAVHELENGRLIRKVRSGITFLQGSGHAVAFGPLAENESTVINFVNTQILSAALREGWQLCHAAAVTGHGRTLAISGLSGGGKSTSILRMMDIKGTRFLSNDRVLVRGGTPPRALGIPKHPRINPGTILGNPKLHGMLAPERLAEITAMPTAELWELEDKHDLIIPDVYGSDRIQHEADLTDFWVLNWQHNADAPTQLHEVDLANRPDLLGAIMKIPGPFYQHPDGTFEPNGAAPNAAAYIDALKNVRLVEVTGRIDFDVIAAHGHELFNG